MWGEADRRDDPLLNTSNAVTRLTEKTVTETLHLAGLLRETVSPAAYRRRRSAGLVAWYVK